MYKKILKGVTFEGLLDQGYDPRLLRRAFKEVTADTEFHGKFLVNKMIIDNLMQKAYDMSAIVLKCSEIHNDHMQNKAENAKLKEILKGMPTLIDDLKPRIKEEIRKCTDILGLDSTLHSSQAFPIDKAVSNITDIIKQELSGKTRLMP